MRKLAALALAGVVCFSGSAFATDPGSYYLQLGIGLAPMCGPRDCFTAPCNISGVGQFTTVHLTTIVDCHKGEGFLGAQYGLTESSGGTLAIHTGFTVCPGFLQGPGSAPLQVTVASTSGCQVCCTAVGSHSYLLLAPAPIVWSLGPNTQIGAALVIDCGFLEIPVVCLGQATANSAAPVACQCAGPTATEPSSWGNLKALYN
jgi:hypothetical protein